MQLLGSMGNIIGRLAVLAWLTFLYLLAPLACLANEPDGNAQPSRITQDYFPVLPWELPPRAVHFDEAGHGLPSVAECGFTTAAFVLPRQLDECRRLHLRALVRLDPALDPWGKLSDQQIVERVRKIIAGTQNDPIVLGYFLEDEPGIKEFPALGKAVAAIKQIAPGKLAYINVLPDYATLGAPDLSQLGTKTYAEYLEEYVREVKPQFIGYDNYRVQYSGDMKDARMVAGYYRNLLEVRKVALEHGLPFWDTVSSNEIRPVANQAKPVTPPPSPANMLLQAYTTLASGAQGLTWFTYYAGRYHYAPVDKDGHRTATWSYLRMVNDQVRTVGPIMRKLRSTGVYFSAPAPAGDLPVLPGEIVTNVLSPTPIMVGEFSGANDEKYVMVVNMSLEASAKIQMEMSGQAKLLGEVSPVDGSLMAMEPDLFWLTAGQGVLFKVGK